MTDERKAEIERLAGIFFNKRRHFLTVGMAQTPLDPEEARKSAQAYAGEQAEVWEAEKALHDAQMNETKFHAYVSFGTGLMDTTPDAEDDSGMVEVPTVTLDGQFTAEEIKEIAKMFLSGGRGAP